MKMRAKQKPSTAQTLSVKYYWVIGSSLVLSATIISTSFFGLNMFGIQYDTKAQVQEEVKTSRYPFDISDKTLQQVNFMALSTKVNSVFAEVRPLITADGKSLFFCRRNHPGNVSKQDDNQDIWLSTLDASEQWTEPKNLGNIINTKNADAICSVNPDGTEIVFVSDLIDPKKPLLKSVKTATGWGQPQGIEIENFYNRNSYIDFFYAFSSNVLLMAIEREDSRGEQDLYVSFPRGNNKWSEPKTLGSIVNSRLSEFAPFLSADGKTLYFSSYGHKGFGGCDIYQTTRLDDTWKNWSEPKNLGAGINSPREESYFSISGDNKHIYFESYDLKKEVRDVFRADIPEAYRSKLLPDQMDIMAKKDR